MRRMRGMARAWTRALAVFAVLAGLFLMHGLAPQGCPSGEGMAITATPTAGTMRADEFMGASPASADRHLSAAMSPVQIMATGHGELCTATSPPQPSTGLALLLALAALITAAAAMGSSTWTIQVRRRPPSPTGSALLTTLCVSRM